MAKKKRRATKKATQKKAARRKTARKKEPARRKAAATPASKRSAAPKKATRRKATPKKAPGKDGKRQPTSKEAAPGKARREEQTTETVTAEEIGELPIEAAVVFAARCAMRVQPLVGAGSFGDVDEVEIRKHLEAIDSAVSIAAAYPVSDRAAAAAGTAAHASARAANAAKSEGAAAASLAAALAVTAQGDAAAAFGPVRASRVAVGDAYAGVAGYAAADAAARDDLEVLTRKTMGSRAFDSERFLQRVLWPQGEPSAWGTVVEEWSEGMNSLGLGDIVERYQHARRGEGYDLEDARRRIAIWYHKTRLEPQSLPTDAPNERDSLEPNIGAAAAMRDQPSPVDHLGREHLVEALAAMFAAREQGTPFTLGLLGDWGAGKSSVMKQIEDRLIKHAKDTLWKRFIAVLGGEVRPLRQWIAGWRSAGDPSLRNPHLPRLKFHFADFNVWKYELTEDIRAGLAQEVVRGLTGDMNWWTRSRLKLNFGWVQHRWPMLRALALLIAAGFAVRWAWLSTTAEEIADVSTWTGPVLRGSTTAVAVAFGMVLWRNIKPLLEHPVTKDLQAYLKLPDYGKHLGAVPVMKEHIEKLCELRGVVGKDPTHRLIVFVDDLDRCGHQGIAEAFDAVRLVMDIPNVIVVIAVDHRIAFRAVARHYKDLADADRPENAIARDYLGKIIQLPVELPEPLDMSPYTRNHLFAGADPSEVDAARKRLDAQESSEERDGDQAEDGPETAAPDDVAEADDEPLAVDETGAPPEGPAGEGEPEPESKVKAEPKPLKLMRETADHCALFEKWSESFGFVNPRQLLRLRNTFRLLIQLNQAKVLDKRDDEKDLLVMLFWLEYINRLKPDARAMSELALYPDEDKENAKEKAKEKTKERDKDKERERVEKILKEANKALDAIGVRPVLGRDSERYKQLKAEIGRFVLPYGSRAAPTADAKNAQ